MIAGKDGRKTRPRSVETKWETACQQTTLIEVMVTHRTTCKHCKIYYYGLSQMQISSTKRPFKQANHQGTVVHGIKSGSFPETDCRVSMVFEYSRPKSYSKMYFFCKKKRLEKSGEVNQSGLMFKLIHCWEKHETLVYMFIERTKCFLFVDELQFWTGKHGFREEDEGQRDVFSMQEEEEEWLTCAGLQAWMTNWGTRLD